MKLAFILDPLESIKTSKDSSYAMMREAAARNHQLFVMQQKDLVWKHDKIVGFARSLALIEKTHEDSPWYQTGETKETPLQAFDAVLMRKDPPFDIEYIYSTYLLELAEDQGAYIINSPRAVRDYNEKLSIAKFQQFIAPTLVTKQECLIREFLAEHRDIVLKPLDGMGGASVFRLHLADYNVSVILETLTHYGTRTVMAQQYLPEISEGDKRIIVIAGQAAPYALARIPRPGETRGNLAAGGTGIVQPLSKRDREIAETLGTTLRDDGLMLAGLDVIGDFLTEINVTSPTGMQEITRESGFNVAAMMLDEIEKNVKKPLPQRNRQRR